MRALGIGTQRFTTVAAGDEVGAGGANRHYYITRSEASEDTPVEEFGHISFQNGPVKEIEVNGCFMEDLLVIVIDRLRGFQAGDFACRENALALTKLEEALHWLNHRTALRQKRGVEGTHEL